MISIGEKPVYSSFSLCFSKLSLLCVAVLVPSLWFTSFQSSGLCPTLLTISTLIISTISLLAFKKKKNLTLVENPVEKDQSLISSHQSQLENEIIEKKRELVLEADTEHDIAQQSEVGLGHGHDDQVESLDLGLDSESNFGSMTSEDFELNWDCSNNLGRERSVSDDSISVSEDDEDSLIEISLPVNESIDLNEEPPNQKLQSNLPSFLPESVFTQQDLMDLLVEINEVNEEENLIEIDISMGSIKCSRLVIEA